MEVRMRRFEYDARQLFPCYNVNAALTSERNDSELTKNHGNLYVGKITKIAIFSVAAKRQTKTILRQTLHNFCCMRNFECVRQTSRSLSL